MAKSVYKVIELVGTSTEGRRLRKLRLIGPGNL